MQKLEFTLKQHTPLIHFQWEQVGATIRPTELKSKLDKWILQRLTSCYGLSDELLKIALKDETISPWIKGTRKKEHSALNYSVTVLAHGGNQFKDELNTHVKPVQKRDGTWRDEVDEKDYPPFFGNQMKVNEWNTGDKKIKRMSYYAVVTIIFETIDDDLRKVINKEFPLFLLHTNFGTRQSKGFGSFYIDMNDKAFPKMADGTINEGFFIRSFDYCFDIKTEGQEDTDNTKDLFTQIDLFYKTLRGGISPNDIHSLYFKSLMWKYAKSKNLQWEKKTIKQEYFSIHEANQKLNHPEKDTPLDWAKGKKIIMTYPESEDKKDTHLLWRDLLGLSSEQQWGSYYANIKKSSITKDPSARFKSPLFFKPLRTGLHTYRVFFEIPDYIKDAFLKGKNGVPEANILGEWFAINKDGAKSLELPYPESFDFDKFFEVAFTTNPNTYVKNGDQIIKPDGTPQRKKHGKIIRVQNNNGSWIEKENPSFIRLQSIFSQLAYQVEHKIK